LPTITLKSGEKLPWGEEMSDLAASMVTPRTRFPSFRPLPLTVKSVLETLSVVMAWPMTSMFWTCVPEVR